MQSNNINIKKQTKKKLLLAGQIQLSNLKSKYCTQNMLKNKLI